MSDEKKNLVISASQLDDFTDCPRRWWFKRVMRLKEVQKGYFTFGTVLHGCIERWMAATENGRVPSPVPEILAGQTAGEPVEVFPDGWETIEEKGQKVSVTPNEARLIRRLFKEAVERGIISRSPHTSVEREIKLPVLDGVDLIGYVDIHVEPEGSQLSIKEVHDHKSFGESSTRYLKQPGPTDAGGNLVPIEEPYQKGDGTSPNCVGHVQQNLTYAAATSMLDGYDGDVLVRHNQYPKFDDPKGVRQVSALVSPKRLAAHWAFVQDTAKRMVLVSRIKKWTDTPGPESTDACSRYGGCPFQGICGKRETPEVYSQRVERMSAQRTKGARPNLTLTPRKRKTKSNGGNTNMDVFARAKSVKGGTTAAPAKPAPATKPAATTKPAPAAKPAASTKPAPASKPAATKPAPAAKPAVNSAPAPTPETASGGAPWGNPTCPACKGYGINSKGRACPICDKTAAKRGVPSSSQYAIELGDDGTVTAVAREEHAEAIEAMGAESAWAGEVPQAGAPAPAAKPAPAPAAEAEPEQEADEAATDAPDEGEPETTEEAADEAPEQPAPPPARPSPRAAAQAALARGGAPSAGQARPSASKPAPAAEAPARGAGRPRVGITVLIGASQLKGPERPTLLAVELLERVGAELAADMGSESYWTLDPFKRRERIRQKGAEIAESLGKTVIMVGSTNDPDVMNLANALAAAPACEAVFEGLR